MEKAEMLTTNSNRFKVSYSVFDLHYKDIEKKKES